MALGALVVAGLVVWALTRTVERPTDVATTQPPTATDLPIVSPPPTTAPPAGTTDVATMTAAVTTAEPTPPPPSAQGDANSVRRMAAEDLRQRFNAHEVTIVDVRDDASYANGHIPGALHIPMASIEANLDRLPKGREIVTYCT